MKNLIYFLLLVLPSLSFGEDVQTQMDAVQQLIQQESSVAVPDRETAYNERLNTVNQQGDNPGAGQRNDEDSKAYRERLNEVNRQVDNPNERNKSFMSASDKAYQDRLKGVNSDIDNPNKNRNDGDMSESERVYQERLQNVNKAASKRKDGGGNDSCDVTMCMFGMVAGGGDASECSDAVSKFFGIQVFSGFMGSFDPVKTEVERKTFLKKCDKGVDNQIDSIISKFGQIQG